MGEKVFELPVNLVKDHISDFCVTLPLCVALTDPKLLPWYYENFTNICSTGRRKALCFSEFGQSFMGLYNEIFKYSNIPVSSLNKHDICDLIISQLVDNKNYCYSIR